MVVHDRVEAGDTGQHSLGTTAKASKDMRLDKAGQDLERGLMVISIDHSAMPIARGAQVHQIVFIPGVMLDYCIVVRDVCPQHLL